MTGNSPVSALKRILQRTLDWLFLVGLIFLGLAFVAGIYMLDKFRWTL